MGCTLSKLLEENKEDIKFSIRFYFFENRSVRENCTNAERKATQEEEDEYKEVYAEPVLQ